MTLEQSKEFNRFVDASIPLTWHYRWRRLRPTLPLLVFSLACLLSMTMFRAWLADKMSLDTVITIVAGALFLLAFVFIIVEIEIRIRQCSKRVIRIEDKGIFIQPAKHRFMAWKHISTWQFEPIPNQAGLTKLTVFGLVSKLSGFQPNWSLVLDKPTKVRECISELERRNNFGKAKYQINILNEPTTSEKPKAISLAGLWPYLSGMFLILHGAPLLIIGLQDGNNHSEHHSQLTPEERAKLGRFILAHFSSLEELRRFYVVVGGTLTVCGLALITWGWVRMCRTRKQNGSGADSKTGNKSQ